MCFELRLEPLHDGSRLSGMRSASDAQVDIRSGNRKIPKKTIGHLRRIMLPRVNQPHSELGPPHGLLENRPDFHKVGPGSNYGGDLNAHSKWRSQLYPACSEPTSPAFRKNVIRSIPNSTVVNGATIPSMQEPRTASEAHPERISYYKASFAPIHLHHHSRLQRRKTFTGNAREHRALPRKDAVGVCRNHCRK
jgi:hypothetical protein